MKNENGLEKEIERVNNGGEANVQGFFIPNPSGWYVFSFTGEGVKPNLCAGENCVCICEAVTFNIFDWQKRQVEKCDNKGSCAAVSNLEKFEMIKIEKGGISLSIAKVNDGIKIARK